MSDTEIRDRIKGMKSVLISKIKGFQAGNPKTYGESQRALLDHSLKTHGYVLPMAVRETDDGGYELIDGHHRLDILATENPDGKIKVIILDVDSVAEGKRILLALQAQTGFDMGKLEDFVQGMIKYDGITAADIMADTGLTASDLESLASAGTEFLDGMSDPAPAEDTTNEGPSRAGLTTEHVQFAVPLTRDQNQLVHKAVKLAKKVADVSVSADALVAICQHYLDTKMETK